MVASLGTFATGQSNKRASQLESAFRAFWDAKDPRGADQAARQIIASGATLEEIRDRLEAGRPYSRARTGRVELRAWAEEAMLDNSVEIPAQYDPARAWPVRVSLHGGVNRQPPPPGELAPRPVSNRIPIEGEIVILPRAWATSQWWTDKQVDNILGLLDRVKRTYNVDESRVYVTGFSDGGTGVYFLAMRAATPWSACVPLHGQPSVLANAAVRAEGQLFAGNVANCPLHIVNGGRDPLYPAAAVAPYVDMFRRAGGVVDFQVYPEAGHDMSWWPEERPRLEAFLAAHRRAAHPANISWETERTDRHNRFRWLVIERLGARASDSSLADINTYSPAPGIERPLFRRTRPSGRVDARRDGNRFELKTRGVQELTLLLSDDVVRFDQAIRVTVNGQVVHDAVIKPDAATLLTWAARDNDRTMLYGAALRIAVP
ncbi:MAG TPA: dienelactone hydrolase family protein [Vicinamibacterales bacterium]|nr:dienelactone hydrolase family protein [Vicinamibacterales bacterium]